MVSHIKNSNVIFGALLITGLVGSAYEAYQINKISKVNYLIATEQLLKNEAYPYLQKFTAAYDQGNKKDYKHAVQTYGANFGNFAFPS